jgi:putative PIN family toxin of toxin-antitoxin system
MRYIVLDTNCLLLCLAKRSKFHSVWNAFLNEEFILCISNEIIGEYEEILIQKSTPEFADIIIKIILGSSNILHVNPSFRFNLIFTDPDDNKFVDCAIVANAEYIVSQDSHFNVLKTIDFPKINVIRIDEFAKTLSEEV